MNYFLGPFWKLISLFLLFVSLAADLLDGYIARKIGQATRFGQIFDPVTDFITVNSYYLYMFFTLGDLFSQKIAMGLRVVIVAVIVRYIFVAITVKRTDDAYPGYAKATIIGKCSSGSQMLIILFFMSLRFASTFESREFMGNMFLAAFTVSAFLAVTSAINYHHRYLQAKLIARTSS